jgi:hypothetical protein
MWLAALGVNVSFSRAAVSNTPTLFEPSAATYSAAPSPVTASPVGVARLCSLMPAGLGTMPYGMCLFRWRGAGGPPPRTVMRASCSRPRTLEPAKIPGPSKRTSLRASLLLA